MATKPHQDDATVRARRWVETLPTSIVPIDIDNEALILRVATLIRAVQRAERRRAAKIARGHCCKPANVAGRGHIGTCGDDIARAILGGGHRGNRRQCATCGAHRWKWGR